MTKEQERQLKTSLERFDLVEVPAIDTDNTILAGHQRLRVMHMLGRSDEEIDVRIPNRKLTDEEFKEYNVRSNKNTGEWDFDILKGFGELLLKDVGFDTLELDKMFAEAEEDEDEFDPDEAYQSISEPKAKLGDIYMLGTHRLMCGDSTKTEDVEKLMDGNIADMVFSDPPYNIAYEGGMNTNGQNKREMIKNDEMSGEQFYEFLDKAIGNMLKFCNGVFYICMSSKELASLKDTFEKNGGHWQSFIIWVKNTFTLSRSDWQNQYEPILYGWNANKVNHYFAGFRDEGNVWENLEKIKPVYDGEITTIKIGNSHLELKGRIEGRVCNKKDSVDIWYEKKPTKSTEHPTMKPIKLVAKAVKASSKRGDMVLDLFGGSGSTLIACEETARICYMMEYDPKYVDVIIARYEKLTAQPVIKIN